MKKSHLISLGFLLVFFVIVVVLLIFISINSISSDSAYYNLLSKQIIRDQKIVTSADYLEDRPVMYPQLFFVTNAIFMMFMGDYFFKIILFVISLLIILLTYSIFNLKKGSFKLFLIVIVSAVFFSSSFFYVLLRYKIETFLFLFILIMIYSLVRKRLVGNWVFVYYFSLAIIFALKQHGLLLLPFLFTPLFILKKDRVKIFLLALVLILLLSFPSYLVMKASSNYFLGSPIMKLPFLDNLNINFDSIPHNKFYVPGSFGEEGMPPLNQLGNNGLSLESLSSSFKIFEGANWLLFSFKIMFPILLILFIFFFLRFKEDRLLIITLLILILLSVFAYIKVINIWLYFIYVNFLFETTFFYFIVKLLERSNFKSKRLIVCFIIILVVILSANLAIEKAYSVQRVNNQNIKGIIEMKKFVPENFYAMGNRAYEFSYYYDKPFLLEQQEDIDFTSEANFDEEWDGVYSEFLDRNDSFLDPLKVRGINHLIFVKTLKGYDKSTESYLIHLEDTLLIKKSFENEVIVCYQIN
jgi:hypothetical protein